MSQCPFMINLQYNGEIKIYNTEGPRNKKIGNFTDLGIMCSIFIDIELGGVECCYACNQWHFKYKNDNDIKIFSDINWKDIAETFTHVQSFKVGNRTFTLPV